MSDVHLGVGSYAADAMDAREEEEFAAHLAGCADCQREIRELSEVKAELTHLTAVAPPPELRSAVLGAIRGVHPLPSEAPGETAPVAVAPAPPAAPDAVRAAPVDELAVRRERRARRIWTAVAAAAVVVALALGGWAYGLTQQQQTQVAQERVEEQLLRAPDTKILTARLSDGGHASFVVSQEENRALFLGTNLPSPPSGRDYQLWRIFSDTDIRPDAVLAAGGDQRVFIDDVRQAIALAVSLEPDGGSQSPTHVLARPSI